MDRKTKSRSDRGGIDETSCHDEWPLRILGNLEHGTTVIHMNEPTFVGVLDLDLATRIDVHGRAIGECRVTPLARPRGDDVRALHGVAKDQQERDSENER